MRLILATFTSLILLCSPSWATDISAEGAEHLKSMFQNLIEKQKQRFSDEGTSIEYVGDVIVETADSYYAATLPKTIIHMTDKEGQKFSIQIGMVTANIMPHDKPKYWKMSTAVPSPILGLDEKGTETVRMNIGKQYASGIWHEDFENFVQLKAAYENITGDINNTPNILNISKIGIMYDLKEDQDGRWTGPTDMTLADLNISSPTQNGFLKLGEIAIKASADRFSQKKALELESLIETLAMNTEEIDTDTETASEEQTKTSPEIPTAQIIDLVLNLTNSLNFDIQLSDFKLQTNGKNEMTDILDMGAAGESKEKKSLNIDKLHFGFSFDGIMQDLASNSIKTSILGFDISPIDNPETAGLTPSKISISVDTNNIPLKQIATMIKNAGSSENALSPTLLLLKLPAILSQAGTTLNLKTDKGNNEWNTTLNGHAKADIGAAFSATALLNLDITNIETLIAYAEKGNATASDERSTQLKDVVKILKTIKDIGKITKDPAGNAVHSYTLTLDQAGNILLNDQPALPIFMKIQAPMQEDKQAGSE